MVGRRRASERAIDRSIVRFVSGLYPPSVVLRSTASAFASASTVVRRPSRASRVAVAARDFQTRALVFLGDLISLNVPLYT